MSPCKTELIMELQALQRLKYVISHISHMPNVTLSVPEEIYRKMKKRSDVRWSEVARRAIAEQLERLEGPTGFSSSSIELKNMLAKAGVELGNVPVEKAVRHYRRMRRLEWQRASSIRAN